MKTNELAEQSTEGIFFWGCPSLTWKLLCRANYLTKSRVGLHQHTKRAMVYALPRIKLCWTGRDWAISHPMDNPQKKIPSVLLCHYYIETLNNDHFGTGDIW